MQELIWYIECYGPWWVLGLVQGIGLTLMALWAKEIHHGTRPK